MVRAKFKVDSITRTKYSGNDEMYTVKLSPVYANGDPEHENSKFWKYTPSGVIELGTVNASAAEYFKLGEEYYIDFTHAKAESSVAIPV